MKIEEVSLIEIKEEKWHRKIFNFIKKLFYRKNSTITEEFNKLEKQKNNERKHILNIDNQVFYKKNDTDLIWWLDNSIREGKVLFSFDKKRVFNVFEDYPHNLSKEEKEIFDKENPYWKNFF